jgi:hypothetical protein
MKQLQIKKSETAKNDLVGALLLYKQFHSPACWRAVEVAERESTTNSKQRKIDSIVQKNKSLRLITPGLQRGVRSLLMNCLII